MLSVDLYSSYFIPVFLLSSASLTDADQVITASRGETVVLPCPSPFNYSDRVNVQWRKDGKSVFCNYYIAKNKTVDHNCRTQFKVKPELSGLTITDVRSSDAGVYNCTVNSLIPPPGEEKSSVLFLNVNVPAGLTVEPMNSSDLSCVDLLCSLEGLSSGQVNFTWTRGSELLLPHQNIENMSSILHLCKPKWTNGDTITCHASYSSTHTLYSQNITLTCSKIECSLNSQPEEIPWLLIGSVVGACVGLLLIILLSLAFCKYERNERKFLPPVFSLDAA